MEDLKQPNYKIENSETKYKNNTRKNPQVFKCENNLLELESDFIRLQDGELKDSQPKIKKEIEELSFKPTIVSIDDMDRFEKNKLKRKDLLK